MAKSAREKVMEKPVNYENLDGRLDALSNREARLRQALDNMNATFEGIPQIEDFRFRQYMDDDGRIHNYLTHLTPDEIMEAKNKAIEEADRMMDRLISNGRVDPGDVSGNARFMLEEAYGQLSYINVATSKVVTEERSRINIDIRELSRELREYNADEHARQERTYDYGYNEANGNYHVQNLGVSVDRDSNAQYFMDNWELISSDTYWKSPGYNLERFYGNDGNEYYYTITRTQLSPAEYEQALANGAEIEIMTDSHGNTGYYEIGRQQITGEDYNRLLEQGGIERTNSYEVGPVYYSFERNHISEDDFYSMVSDYARNAVKQDRGLTDTLYEIQDKEGNKIIITDARDDTQKENTFNDGYGSINIYRVGADGSKEQMTGQDLSAMVKELGLTEKDIKERNAGNRRFPALAELKRNVGKEITKSILREPSKILDEAKREAAEASISI